MIASQQKNLKKAETSSLRTRPLSFGSGQYAQIAINLDFEYKRIYPSRLVGFGLPFALIAVGATYGGRPGIECWSSKLGLSA